MPWSVIRSQRQQVLRPAQRSSKARASGLELCPETWCGFGVGHLSASLRPYLLSTGEVLSNMSLGPC
ncbi:unnamed protein product, partial [Pleuronectes platessa]